MHVCEREGNEEGRIKHYGAILPYTTTHSRLRALTHFIPQSVHLSALKLLFLHYVSIHSSFSICLTFLLLSPSPNCTVNIVLSLSILWLFMLTWPSNQFTSSPAFFRSVSICLRYCRSFIVTSFFLQLETNCCCSASRQCLRHFTKDQQIPLCIRKHMWWFLHFVM